MVSYNHQKEPRKPLGNRRIRLWRVETSLELREEANMKRTKKLLAMALAVMMAFSCLAMPAMAANAESRATTCSTCGGALRTWVEENSIQHRVGGCAVSNMSHTHVTDQLYHCTECTNSKCTAGVNRVLMSSTDRCIYPQR